MGKRKKGKAFLLPITFLGHASHVIQTYTTGEESVNATRRFTPFCSKNLVITNFNRHVSMYFCETALIKVQSGFIDYWKLRKIIHSKQSPKTNFWQFIITTTWIWTQSVYTSTYSIILTFSQFFLYLLRLFNNSAIPSTIRRTVIGSTSFHQRPRYSCPADVLLPFSCTRQCRIQTRPSTGDGGRSFRPWDKGGGDQVGPQFDLKIRGRPRTPGPFPGSATARETQPLGENEIAIGSTLCHVPPLSMSSKTL